jgi:hypothetical protein
MEKKMRGSYVDGSYVPPQEEQVIVKVIGSKPPKKVDSKDKK